MKLETAIKNLEEANYSGKWRKNGLPRDLAVNEYIGRLSFKKNVNRRIHKQGEIADFRERLSGILERTFKALEAFSALWLRRLTESVSEVDHRWWQKLMDKIHSTSDHPITACAQNLNPDNIQRVVAAAGWSEWRVNEAKDVVLTYQQVAGALTSDHGPNLV